MTNDAVGRLLEANKQRVLIVYSREPEVQIIFGAKPDEEALSDLRRFGDCYKGEWGNETSHWLDLVNTTFSAEEVAKALVEAYGLKLFDASLVFEEYPHLAQRPNKASKPKKASWFERILLGDLTND